MKTDHRRHKRSRVFMTAMLRSEFGAGEVKLTNLSCRGACADCLEDLPAGTPVQIERGDIRIEGSVAWSSDGKLGVKFDESVNEQAFRTQSQKLAAYVPTPLSKPAERLSRRGELHWTEIWKSGRGQ
ncbi:MAG: PilZ domain-containing protein [Sphingosinicella sp.]|uniref:PilZ domain-containing protein n=1 Tax=Sphingosinicella sp. TaxID=1917971 RepID=UPI004037F0CF